MRKFYTEVSKDNYQAAWLHARKMEVGEIYEMSDGTLVTVTACSDKPINVDGDTGFECQIRRATQEEIDEWNKGPDIEAEKDLMNQFFSNIQDW